MESIGEFLKIERETRGISLEEISNKTRINIRVLEAIEKDDRDRLPGITFTRGFVKAYAKCIGIDETDTLLRFDHFYKKEGDLEDFKREAVIDLFEEKDRKPFLYIALVLVIIWLVYILISSGGKTVKELTKPREQKTKIEVENEPAEKVTTVKPEEEEPPPKETESEKPPAEPEKPSFEKEKPVAKEPLEEPKPEKVVKKKPEAKTFVLADKHSLIFRSDGIVWMQVQIDDEEPYEVTLRADEVYKVTAYDRFTLKIGDASKVRIELDGEDLGYLGGEKEVKRITLPIKEKNEE